MASSLVEELSLIITTFPLLVSKNNMECWQFARVDLHALFGTSPYQGSSNNLFKQFVTTNDVKR
jgi:hypothetical protein